MVSARLGVVCIQVMWHARHGGYACMDTADIHGCCLDGGGRMEERRPDGGEAAICAVTAWDRLPTPGDVDSRRRKVDGSTAYRRRKHRRPTSYCYSAADARRRSAQVGAGRVVSTPGGAEAAT